jgi:hypothetical protein
MRAGKRSLLCMFCTCVVPACVCVCINDGHARQRNVTDVEYRSAGIRDFITPFVQFVIMTMRAFPRAAAMGGGVTRAHPCVCAAVCAQK